MFDQILSLIAPHSCKKCGKSGNTLCRECFYEIIDERIPKKDIVDTFFVGARKDALKKLVGDYKFNSERESAKVIAKLLTEILPELPDDILIVPIPTIGPHIRERGFDHMRLVAKYLSRELKIPYSSTILGRKNNSVQHKSADRKKSAADAFYKIREPKQKNILLIDDIYTSGATIEAAKKLLKNHKIYTGIICYQDNNYSTK